jgi:hypothetical protein
MDGPEHLFTFGLVSEEGEFGVVTAVGGADVYARNVHVCVCVCSQQKYDLQSREKTPIVVAFYLLAVVFPPVASVMSILFSPPWWRRLVSWLWCGLRWALVIWLVRLALVWAALGPGYMLFLVLVVICMLWFILFSIKFHSFP